MLYSVLSISLLLAVSAQSFARSDVDFLVKRSHELSQSAQQMLAHPKVEGYLVNKTRVMVKDLEQRKLSEVEASSPKDFRSAALNKATEELLVLENSLEQLLDLVKLVEQSQMKNIVKYAQSLVDQVNGLSPKIVQGDYSLRTALQSVTDALNEKQPAYLEWYRESKLIDRVLPLLEAYRKQTVTA